MSPLLAQLDPELKAALKSGDSVRLSVLRMLKSDIKKYEVDHPKEVMTEQIAFAILNKHIHLRADAAAQFAAGGRDDLKRKEEAEIAALQSYLPAQVTDAELTALLKNLVAESGALDKKAFGKIMKAAQERLEGRADNKRISTCLNQLLQ